MRYAGRMVYRKIAKLLSANFCAQAERSGSTLDGRRRAAGSHGGGHLAPELGVGGEVAAGLGRGAKAPVLVGVPRSQVPRPRPSVAAIADHYRTRQSAIP